MRPSISQLKFVPDPSLQGISLVPHFSDSAPAMHAPTKNERSNLGSREVKELQPRGWGKGIQRGMKAGRWRVLFGGANLWHGCWNSTRPRTNHSRRGMMSKIGSGLRATQKFYYHPKPTLEFKLNCKCCNHSRCRLCPLICRR